MPLPSPYLFPWPLAPAIYSDRPISEPITYSRSFGIKAINTLLEEQVSLMGWLSMPLVAWCGFQSAFGFQAHHGMDS